jgi:hypothetical protein
VSIHTNTSVPSMSGSPRRLGRNIVVAAGSVVLAAAVGGGLGARRSPEAACRPPRVAVVGPAATESSWSPGASRGYTAHTVYIVGSEEQATRFGPASMTPTPSATTSTRRRCSTKSCRALRRGSRRVRYGVNDYNRILAGSYQVENRIEPAGSQWMRPRVARRGGQSATLFGFRGGAVARSSPASPPATPVRPPGKRRQ